MPIERESQRQPESMLGRAFVEPILDAARENLRRHGELVPALFLRCASGERMAVLLENFPEDSEDKQLYLEAIGITLYGTGRRIEEAIFLSEVWYVEQKGRELETMPRRHPQRREAIVVMGRNRARSRLTHVLQPFHRDDENQPVFEQEVLAEYNTPVGETSPPPGLLDHLFAGGRDNGGL